jgi:hypothetical protein
MVSLSTNTSVSVIATTHVGSQRELSIIFNFSRKLLNVAASTSVGCRLFFHSGALTMNQELQRIGLAIAAVRTWI